jgi:NAD(P)-dependent dehydrogenase (short-subunit alcohol dehydrogenase family)
MIEPIVVLITGCSSGFGRAAAEVLAKKGFRVYAGMRETVGRNADAASELRGFNSENRFLRVVDLDVSSDASVEAAVRQTLQEAGKIDVLVNNAGLFMVGPMEAFTLEQWKMAFETNLFGAVRMDRAVLPSMRRDGNGLLIHISSVAGRLASPVDGVYCASKHALGMVAEVYRYELAPFGVDSVLIEPFVYPTAIFGKALKPADESRSAEYVSFGNIEKRRLGFFDAALRAPGIGDPSELGEKIAELIRLPIGKRPLHNVLPASMQERLNPLDSFMEKAQLRSMEMSGFTDLLEQRARVT